MAVALVGNTVLGPGEAAAAALMYRSARLRCCTLPEFEDWYAAGVAAGYLSKDRLSGETFCRDADPRFCLAARRCHACVRPDFLAWSATTVTADDHPTPVMLRWARRHRIPLRQWVMQKPWWRLDKQGQLF